jgi:hypothetical protein
MSLHFIIGHNVSYICGGEGGGGFVLRCRLERLPPAGTAMAVNSGLVILAAARSASRVRVRVAEPCVNKLGRARTYDHPRGRFFRNGFGQYFRQRDSFFVML